MSGHRGDPGVDAWGPLDSSRVRALTADSQLLPLDPATGAITSSAVPDHASGTLLASPGGRLLLAGGRDYLLTGSGWLRLPDVPSHVVTQGRTTAWAGEQLVVWGGAAAGVRGDHSVNTAEGWTFTTPGTARTG